MRSKLKYVKQEFCLPGTWGLRCVPLLNFYMFWSRYQMQSFCACTPGHHYWLWWWTGRESYRKKTWEWRKPHSLKSAFAPLSTEKGRNLCASWHTVVMAVVGNQKQHLLNIWDGSNVYFWLCHIWQLLKTSCLAEILEDPVIPFLLSMGISALDKYFCLTWEKKKKSVSFYYSDGMILYFQEGRRVPYNTVVNVFVQFVKILLTLIWNVQWDSHPTICTFKDLICHRAAVTAYLI